jgi:hypothetical protein
MDASEKLGGKSQFPTTIVDIGRDISEVTSISVAQTLETRFRANQWAVNLGQGSTVTISTPSSTPVLQSSVATAAIREAWVTQFKNTLEGKFIDGHLPLGPSASDANLNEDATFGASPVNSSPSRDLDPHVFSAVNDAIFQAKKTGQFQSIIFRCAR